MIEMPEGSVSGEGPLPGSWTFFFAMISNGERREGAFLGLFCCFRCSVAKLCLTLCNPMDCNVPGCPVLHYLLEFAQNYIH